MLSRSPCSIAGEPAVEHVDDERERAKRRIGRPSKVARCRPLVEELLEEVDQDSAPLKSVEILRRARLDGYDGGKTALYELIAELRPRSTPVKMRFEGLPGEFSQHDFGQTIIPFFWSGRRTGMAAVQADVRPRSDTVPEWFGWSEIRSLHKHSIPLGALAGLRRSGRHRVGGGVTPAVLPHHRTYGSVYGGSPSHPPASMP